MGNQPNNFVQCGFDNSEAQQEANMTREQAVRQTRDQRFFKPEFIQSKVSQVNVYSDSQYSKRNQPNARPLQTTSIGVKKQQASSMIPEHEGIIKVSKTPKNRYIKVPDSPYFEEAKGKCLDEIIQSRYNSNMHFPEYQIVSLTETLTYSLAYMAKKNMNYHDFYPTNIFYNSGSFKLANPLCVKFSGYSLTQQRKRFTFLSPELIIQILNDKPELDIRKDVMDKSDVFAIGMILLQFCTLQPSSECYDPETYSIVDGVIQQRIDKTNSLYNPLIGQCIDLMLQYEVDKRISPIDLAYIVHSKVGQLKTNNIDGEASRIQQNSRVTMSTNIVPSHPQPQEGSPPRTLGEDQFFNGIPKLQQQPFLVSSSPQIPSNARMNPSFNQGIVQPTQASPFYITNPNNFQASPTNVPVMRKPVPMKAYENEFENRQRFMVSTPGPAFVKPEMISQKVNAIGTLPYLPDEAKPISMTSPVPQQSSPSQFVTNPNLSSSRPSSSSMNASSASKIKSNPFDEIKQDLKGEQEDSPQKFTIKINVPPAKTNQNQKFTAYKTAILDGYEFKTKQEKSLTNGPSYSTSTTSSVGPTLANSSSLKLKKEQSLDERVRKILEASQNIK